MSVVIVTCSTGFLLAEGEKVQSPPADLCSRVETESRFQSSR